MAQTHEKPTSTTESTPQTKQQHVRRLEAKQKQDFDKRDSTFDRFPQYIFPSSFNASTVPGELERPWAYSHHQAAFYWTEADALSALHWNIYARPPCLNCVLAGSDVARRCNRWAKQWKTRGTRRCCTCCQEAVLAEACVEMVELRIIPNFAAKRFNGTNFTPRFDKGGVDLFLWSAGEVKLRNQGKVIWRPINLKYGDVELKRRLMVNFESRGACGLTMLEINAKLLERKKRNPDAEFWLQSMFMMDTKVEYWRRAELAAKVFGDITNFDEPSQSLVEINIFRPSQGHGVNTNPGQVLQTTTQMDAGSDKENLPKQRIGADERLEERYGEWRAKLMHVRLEERKREITTLSQAEAEKKEAGWNQNVGETLKWTRIFWEDRLGLLVDGMEEANACWEAARFLPRAWRLLIEEYMPQMLFPEVGGEEEGETH